MKRYFKTAAALIASAVLLAACSPVILAIDEAEVQAAVADSGKEVVAGNIFIWFLCAVGFLKVSQKLDSFLSQLGLNVGR